MALTRKELKEVLDVIVRANQGNADHLMGEVQKVAKFFNELAGDIDTLYSILGIVRQEDDGDNEPQSVASNLVNTHDDLDGVTSDQHHSETHLLWGTDHTDVTSTDTPADGEVITWDSATSKWIAEGIPGDTGGRSPKRGSRPPATFIGEQADTGDNYGMWVPGGTGSGGIGPSGADGAPGAQGGQGIPGFIYFEDAEVSIIFPGPTGATGTQGPAGADGAPGSQGGQGIPGITYFEEDSAYGMWIPAGGAAASGSASLEVDEDGAGPIVSGTDHLDFRHGLDVTTPGGTTARVAVDETELDHDTIGGIPTHASDTLTPDAVFATGAVTGLTLSATDSVDSFGYLSVSPYTDVSGLVNGSADFRMNRKTGDGGQTAGFAQRFDTSGTAGRVEDCTSSSDRAIGIAEQTTFSGNNSEVVIGGMCQAMVDTGTATTYGVTMLGVHSSGRLQAATDQQAPIAIALETSASGSNRMVWVYVLPQFYTHEAAHIAHDTLWDAKGDLASGSGADTAVKTTVGADGTILKADSTAGGGISWATVSSLLSASTATKYIYLRAQGDITPDTATTAQTGSGSTTAIPILAYADAAQLYSTATFIVPDDWASGTIDAQIIWAPSTANTGDCRWVIEPAEIANGDDDQEASAGAVIFLSTGSGNANFAQYTSFQSLLTPSGAGKVVRLVVWRNGTAGTDTFTGIGRLIGVLLRYTASTPPGPAGAAGAAGANSTVPGPPGLVYHDEADIIVFPGPAGAAGSQGTAGADGTVGHDGAPGLIYHDEGDFIIFPGPAGPAGTNGVDGAPGAAAAGGGMPFFGAIGEEALDYQMVVPPKAPLTQTVLWSSKKRVSAGQASQRIYLPEPCSIVSVYFTLPGSSTSTATIDVKKNGTTIFTGTGPTLTSGYISNVVIPTTNAMLPTDYLTVHITNPGNTAGRLLAYITTKR